MSMPRAPRRRRPARTSSSAISKATPRASSRPTSRPKPPAATSSRSPSSRSRATRPRTCCCARRSSRRRARRSTRSRPAPGAPRRSSGSPSADRDLYNAAAVCAHGTVLGRLPQAPAAELRGVRRGALLRAVADRRAAVRRRRRARRQSRSARTRGARRGPILTQAAGGAELIVNINASPYYAGRLRERETMLATRAADASVPARLREPRRRPGRARLRRRVDGLRRGRAPRRARHAVRRGPPRRRPRRAPRVPAPRRSTRVAASRAPRCPRSRSATPSSTESSRPARSSRCSSRCTRSTRRSCSAPATTSRKNGFADVLIGLSGGIDSSLVAAIAVDALGADHVVGVLMPSRYSSEGSVTDAEALAATSASARSRSRSSPPTPRSSRCSPSRSPGLEPGLAEENLQARIRGTILMTLSNKFGWLVLTTGNKSEMATGYSTLYGDMAGGFAVHQGRPEDARVRAVPRPQRARRARSSSPSAVIEKPPSAELRPDQTRQRLAARRTPCSIRSSRATSRTTSRSPSSRPRATTRRRCGAGRAADRPQRVQAPPGAARRAGVAEGVRQGPPPPDHQPLARLTPPRLRRGCAHESRFAAEGALVLAGVPLRRHVPARRRRARRRRRRSRTSCCGSRSRCWRSRRSRSRSRARHGEDRRLLVRVGSRRRRAALRRVRDADGRVAGHVAVDLGVHHRPVRVLHAVRRSRGRARGSRRRG